MMSKKITDSNWFIEDGGVAVHKEKLGTCPICNTNTVLWSWVEVHKCFPLSRMVYRHTNGRVCCDQAHQISKQSHELSLEWLRGVEEDKNARE